MVLVVVCGGLPCRRNDQVLTDPQSLGALIDMLRKAGVRSFSGTLNDKPVSLELGPDIATPATSKPPTDEEKCLCGCPVHAHVNGLCIANCSPEKCAGPE